MAVIKIFELRPAGSQLFQDAESFLNELSDREMAGIEGGVKTLVGFSFSVKTLFSIKSNTVNANSIGQINIVG